MLRWQDAAEFILAGASAVEMGTALFADPRSPLKVATGLAKWARRQGAANVRDLVGAIDLSEPDAAAARAVGGAARPARAGEGA